MGRSIRTAALVLACAVLLAGCGSGPTYRVSQDNMVPTLHRGDRIEIDSMGQLDCGIVVAFRDRNDRVLFGRVIANPNSTAFLRGGHVRCHGQPTLPAGSSAPPLALDAPSDQFILRFDAPSTWRGERQGLFLVPEARILGLACAAPGQSACVAA